MEGPTLTDYLRMVARRRYLVAASVAIGFAVALVLSLILPKVYRAEAAIFVQPQTNDIVSTLAAQAGIPLVGNQGQVPYVLATLKSSSLADAVIEQVKFPPAAAASAQTRLPVAPDPDTAVRDPRVKALMDMLSVREDEGLVTLGIENTDPVLAARIANAYLTQLGQFLQKPTTRKRLFIERQVEDVRRRLTAAEERLRAFQEQHRTVAIDVETEQAITALVTQEGLLAQAEAALAENLSLTRESGSLDEIAGLQTQRAGLLARRATLQRQINTMRSEMAAIPQEALAFARRRRDVDLLQSQYRTFLEQEQLAAIAEQQEDAVFQTIDRAAVPGVPIRPRIPLNLVLGLFTGLLLGVLTAISLEGWVPRLKETWAAARA